MTVRERGNITSSMIHKNTENHRMLLAVLAPAGARGCLDIRPTLRARAPVATAPTMARMKGVSNRMMRELLPSIFPS